MIRAEETLYSRETALFAALAAWLFGIGTGLVVAVTYKPDAAKASREQAATLPPVRPAALPPVQPSPSPSDWTVSMAASYKTDCPKIMLRELRMHDNPGDRSVTVTLRLNNEHPDRDCHVRGEAMFIRDGDGNTYRHDGGDIRVAALGVKEATLTFTVPLSLEIAQFVFLDDDSGNRAVAFDLVPPQGAFRGR